MVVIVAPSGAGKTTLAKRLMRDYPDLVFSVSATTRPPRPHEVPGKDYYFLSREEFEQKIQEGGFLEWEEFYSGYRYGTLRGAVEEQLEQGNSVLFDVEVKGAMNIKSIYGEGCLSIFIKPPSLKALEHRLRNRGTENEQTLQMRMQRARMELEYENKFDCVIVNNDLETAYKELRQHVDCFMNETDQS